MNKLLSIKDNVRIVEDETAKKILNYSPPIYLKEHGKTDGTKIELIASSLLFNHDGNFFLFTAGHVIQENDPEDLGILIGNIFHILVGEIRYVNPYQDSKSYKIDIAVWKLDPDLAKNLKLNYQFLTIDNVVLDHSCKPKDPRYLIVGFPWRRAKLNPIKKTIKVNPFIFLTNVADEKTYKDLRLDSYSNIILNYRQRKIIDGKTGRITKGVTPDGLSGCGVWFIEKFIYFPSKAPQLKLLSIVTDQDKNKRYLQSTRIDLINEVLIRDFSLKIKHSNTVRL
jgi:hypothetical protein